VFDDEEDQTVLALRGIEDTSSDDGSDLETAIRSDSGWGNKKSTLYGADNTELEIEYDSEDARDEEEEAIGIQQQDFAGFTEKDFDMDYVTASAVASKKKKTKRKAIGQQVFEESATESKKKKKKKKIKKMLLKNIK
jgi:poly(A) polymerase Pap1